ncbi:hypothetical protein DMP23_21065 [Amycolatopsis sp. A1MSW2902]
MAGVRVNRRWPPYPRFDPEFAAALIDRLDVPAEMRQYLADAGRRYAWHRWLFASMEIFYFAAYLLLALGFLAVDGMILTNTPSPLLQVVVGFSGLAVAFVLVPAVFFRIIWWDRSTATQRAARACGQLLRQVRFDEHRIRNPQPGGWLLTRLGVMAKSAFLITRGGSFTWTVPPAVSDRATGVALPLLDIALPSDIDLPGSEAYRQALAEFAAEAVYLIIARRPDLLQRLRRQYSHRLDSRDADVADRDARYLDPLRGHTPWEVAKDHVLPIVALLVSLVALIRR